MIMLVAIFRHLAWRIVAVFVLIVLSTVSIHALCLRYSSMVSKYDITPVLVYIGLFYLFFFITLVFGIYIFKCKWMAPDKVVQLFEFNDVEKLLRVIAIVSAIGLLFHLIAKGYIFFTNDIISFSQFRSVWINADREAFPIIVRLISIMGHLLVSFVFSGLFLLTLLSANFSGNVRLVVTYLMTYLIILLIYGMSIYSKNIILSGLVVLFLGYLLSAVIFPRRFKNSYKRLAMQFSAVVILLAIFVFIFMTAKMDSNNDFVNYMQGYTDELPVSIPKISSGDYQVVRKCIPCEIIALYLNHGIWNFAKIYHVKERGEAQLFKFLFNWIGRFVMPVGHGGASRVHGRGGLTLPGAAYHDFGLPGLIITAIILALVLVVGIYLLYMNGIYLTIGVLIYLAVGFTMFYSLLFVGPAVISFPFIILSNALILGYIWYSGRRTMYSST